jgi:hypothetical protein
MSGSPRAVLFDVDGTKDADRGLQDLAFYREPARPASS